jgi:hypothetical protein
MKVLKAAADELRLELLLQAEKRGTLHTRDAKATAPHRLEGHDSGNIGYHLGKLVDGGLLARPAYGEYELTFKGAQLLELLRRPGPGRDATAVESAEKFHDVHIVARVPASVDAPLPAVEFVGTLIQDNTQTPIASVVVRVTRDGLL